MLLQVRDAQMFDDALNDPKSSDVLVPVLIYLAMILAIALFTLVVILIVKSIKRLDSVADKMIDVEKSVILFQQQNEITIQRIEQGEREREQMNLRFKNGGSAIAALEQTVKSLNENLISVREEQLVRNDHLVTRPEYEHEISRINKQFEKSDKRQQKILDSIEGMNGRMELIQELLESKTEIRNTKHV